MLEEYIRPRGGGGGREVSVPKFRRDERVEARYRGRAKYYRGRIARERGDSLYDIDYDDGESETRVAAHLIRSLESGASGISSLGLVILMYHPKMPVTLSTRTTATMSQSGARRCTVTKSESDESKSRHSDGFRGQRSCGPRMGRLLRHALPRSKRSGRTLRSPTRNRAPHRAQTRRSGGRRVPINVAPRADEPSSW